MPGVGPHAAQHRVAERDVRDAARAIDGDVVRTVDVDRVAAFSAQGKAASAERKKQRNVTKTFSSDAAITIPDSRVLNALGEAGTFTHTIAPSRK